MRVDRRIYSAARGLRPRRRGATFWPARALGSDTRGATLRAEPLQDAATLLRTLSMISVILSAPSRGIAEIVELRQRLARLEEQLAFEVETMGTAPRE